MGNRNRNDLFNDALNIFYLRLYGVGHMVKDHSDSERGKPAAATTLSEISSKGSLKKKTEEKKITTLTTTITITAAAVTEAKQQKVKKKQKTNKQTKQNNKKQTNKQTKNNNQQPNLAKPMFFNKYISDVSLLIITDLKEEGRLQHHSSLMS